MPKEEKNSRNISGKTAMMNAGLLDDVASYNLIAGEGAIQPGDILTFNYKAKDSLVYEPVVVLVVKTRTSTGVKNSIGTGNKLLTCFKIEDSPESKAILRRLYNNKAKSNINRTSRMFGWMHKKSESKDMFRTYIISFAHMSRLAEIKLKSLKKMRRERVAEKKYRGSEGRNIR